MQMASDPAFDATKFDAVLAAQERLEARQAEIEFNRALARLSKEMPRVKKNGRVELGPGKGSYAFTTWEDIDKVIRPLMTEEGFTLSFDSSPRQGDGGGMVVKGTLLHRDGHSRSASMPLALDTGPGRNNLQAMGSTLSYGKRYCAEMLLNIVREGSDDDGVGAGEPITAEEVKKLSDLLTETRTDLATFCGMWHVQALPDMKTANFAPAMTMLTAKKQSQEKKK
jgi:hypothetical protein